MTKLVPEADPISVAIGCRDATTVAGRLVGATDIRVSAVATSFISLVSHHGFPSKVAIFELSGDSARDHARVSIARRLGCRVIIIDNEPSPAAGLADAVVEQTEPNLEAIVRAVANSLDGRGQGRPGRPVQLTDRERATVELWSRGHSIPEIASQIDVRNATASTFLWRARRKLGAVKPRLEADDR